MKKLNEDLKSGKLKPMYLLTGDEAYLKNQYKKRLREAVLPPDDEMNFSAFSGKNIPLQEVFSLADTMPFFAERRVILIEESGLFKEAAKELLDYLPHLPAETLLIFVETEVDKRLKLYKYVSKQGRAVELKKPDERTMRTWLLGLLKREKKQITEDALELFLQRTGSSMENVVTELEKLVAYTCDAPGITAADVDALTTQTTEGKIYEMLNLMVRRRQREALAIYYDLLSQKESPFKILIVMGRQFAQMLQVKDLRSRGLDGKAIAEKVGLSPYAVKNIIGQVSGYSPQTLQGALEDCVAAVADITGGRLAEQMAVELILVKYSQ